MMIVSTGLKHVAKFCTNGGLQIAMVLRSSAAVIRE
jgi:hypothetical protein